MEVVKRSEQVVERPMPNGEEGSDHIPVRCELRLTKV